MDTLIAIIAAVVGLVAGLIIGLRLGKGGDAVALQEASQRVTEAEQRLAESQAALDAGRQQILELTAANRALEARMEEREQATRQILEQADQRFAAVSQSALARNSEEFLKLARQSFETLAKTTEGQLASREEAIKGVVDPLTELVKRYDQAIKEMELRREGAYSSLDERIRAMLETERGLKTETNRLVTALRRPEVRGRWGEMSLRNAVEAAGMSKYCDFAEQQQVATEGGALRPDMTIRLPGGGTIIVDNKVPLDAYLQAMDAEDPAIRAECLRRHAQQCRKHVESLAKKAYWDQFQTSPNCVIMFIPMESLYMAALEADSELMSSGLQSRVVIATPATFMALLHTVAFGWQQHTFAESAIQVRDLAAQLYERLGVFAGHFEKVGQNLGKSLDAYNKAAGSMERNLLVSARRLKELGTTGKEDLPEMKTVDLAVRQLGPELSPGRPEGTPADLQMLTDDEEE